MQHRKLTNPTSIRRGDSGSCVKVEGEGKKIRTLKTRTCSEQSMGVWEALTETLHGNNNPRAVTGLKLGMMLESEEKAGDFQGVS